MSIVQIILASIRPKVCLDLLRKANTNIVVYNLVKQTEVCYNSLIR